MFLEGGAPTEHKHFMRLPLSSTLHLSIYVPHHKLVNSVSLNSESCCSSLISAEEEIGGTQFLSRLGLGTGP